MKEVWVPISDFEGYYSVSNLGRVRSEDRVIKDSNEFKRSYKGRLRKTFLSNGYEYVNLSKKDIQKKFRVHRLVADAFLKNRLNKEYVNHIDGNKLNNILSNLEWVSSKENTQHALEKGLLNPPIGERAGSSKLTESDVREIKVLLKHTSLNNKRIASKYGVDASTISYIRNNKTWKHVQLGGSY